MPVERCLAQMEVLGKAGDSYSRHVDFINAFFRTHKGVIGSAITSSVEVAS
jgi:hypothetical protein